MNLGRDTIDELFFAIEREFTNAELQRLLLRYNLTGWQSETTTPKMIVKALPSVHSNLNGTNEMGNLVQYVLTAITSKRNRQHDPKQPLSELHPELSNTLLRDGYNTHHFQLTRTIPVELEAAKIPDELTENLVYFSLITALGHLEQAQSNYRDGNWAAANAMVRSCYESVLMFINNNIQPQNPTTSGGDAIAKLTACGFFREDLNEVDRQQQTLGFIGGLWKMLHPHGSHPGLSEEEDSTFRYHVTLVTLNYYLKRLKKTAS
ncbi:hypothetical protein PQ465_09380 [Sphingobacterium oryzagri]|uniref:TIGR02391 family protein n=1 Tax=Sphingobacterium oryzagri TaxID=3025669 RepID=A0ABY7WPU8_9SPHI|nr:hypothetical protein [Sphingobacterium sp. KACC 22765]WDF70569.1 hypothetical protein PQ465_09380 [Sphingobacterium sp. KACC 22765]